MAIPRKMVLRLYVLLLAGAAGALLLRAGFSLPVDSAEFLNALGALFALALVAEAASLSLFVGSVTSSVVFVPVLAAVLLLGPSWAMVIAGVTELVAESVFRNKPAIKLLHNTSGATLAAGIAGYVYVLGGGVPSLVEFDIQHFNPAAFVGATLVYFIINNGATATALALSTETGLFETWQRIVGDGLIENVLSSSISVLLAFLYIELGLFGPVLVILPLFFVRHLHRTNLRVEQANRELLELMVKAIEARDPYTSGHSVRVASYAKALARALGLTPKEIDQIETAALLHDVGKIYEEFAPILRKEGSLTEEEFQVMRTHPIRSAELVGTISALRGYVESCVRGHHENFDGGGYPDGMAGDEIPVGARIIMVADTVDAMMTDRPYRKALTFDDVVAEFEKYSGAQFDPIVVRAFNTSAAIRRLVEHRGPGTESDLAEPRRRIRELAGSSQPRFPKAKGPFGSTTPTRAR